MIVVAIFAYSTSIQVLQLKPPDVLYRLPQGALFTMRFTHSMYGVEVRQYFRAGKDNIILYQVESAESALEYYGIGGQGPGNVSQQITEFTIPGGSVGNYQLYIDGYWVDCSHPTERTTIRLDKITLFEYLMRLIRR
jgi:hypothetical protein